MHLQDRTISQTALPIQVLILQEVGSNNELSESSLSEKFGIELGMIKEICRFWERKGILSNSEDIWYVLENKEEMSHGNNILINI